MEGNYTKSYEILNKLMIQYTDYTVYDNFFVDLIFSYNNIINIYNYKNEYGEKIEYIMNHLDILNISPELKKFCKTQYATYCLSNKKYTNNYLNLINDITGPNVNCNNMAFFKENDKKKTLLVYDGGGIGDKFMFSRFIPDLCNKYKDNKIIFFINDHIKWFF